MWTNPLLKNDIAARAWFAGSEDNPRPFYPKRTVPQAGRADDIEAPTLRQVASRMDDGARGWPWHGHWMSICDL